MSSREWEVGGFPAGEVAWDMEWAALRISMVDSVVVGVVGGAAVVGAEARAGAAAALWM
jgi:hypothetical protein